MEDKTTGYYYTDGARIYFTGAHAYVQVIYRRTEDSPEESVLDTEIVLEDILDAEVIG